MRSPVLFLVFNRPESTRRVFESIRRARPPRLYVAADGARGERVGERARCEEVRRIASVVDWPCTVNTLLRDRNLGCKQAVSTGISWFFSHEEEGVILEDDVLPDESFFGYCDQLLERYRDDERVAQISGCNLIADRYRCRESYFFSRYAHIWGWASWSRVWRHYDVGMTAWPQWRESGGLEALSGGNRFFESHWRRAFDDVYAGNIDTWDVQWLFCAWRRNALTILPALNLTDNLGFDAHATHTRSGVPDYVAANPAQGLPYPLVHPTTLERAVGADALIDEHVFGVNAVNALKRSLGGLPLLSGMKRFVGRFGTLR